MESPSGYGELLRENPSFRSLFAARLVSLLGDWFNTLAVLGLLRALVGPGASTFGWVLVLKTLPVMVAAPLAGVVADRFDRRRVMIATDLIRAAIVLGMLSLLWLPRAGWLYALVIAQTVVSSFFEPARSALLPDVVRPRELTAANALGAAAWSAMLTLGSALGGLVTAYLGWQVAIVVDALTYVISAGLLLKVTPFREPMRRARPEVRTLSDALGVTDVREGIHYLLRRPRILSLALVKPGWCLAGGITLVLTVLGERRYALAGQAMLGVSLLYIARGVGTALGPIVSRALSKSEGDAMERFILFGFLTGAAFYLLLPLARGPLEAAAIVLLAHLGGATIWVFSSIRLQELVPSEVRGRVFAAEQGMFTVTMSGSTVLCGWLIDAEALPLGWMPVALGAALIIPTVWWALRGKRLGYGGEAAVKEGVITAAEPEPETAWGRAEAL